MNSRREGIVTLNQSPSSTSYYDRIVQHLQSNPSLAYLVAILITIYFLLSSLHSPSLSWLRPLWDILVYLTPSRIVAALDNKTNQRGSTDQKSVFNNFQAKSEAMERILGIDNTFFGSLLPSSRSLSGIGATLLGGKDNVPPGLGNWDNSCYQNSIIQSLASLQSLAVFLQRNVDLLGAKSPFSTHQALIDIIQQLNSVASSDQRLWTPPDLKSMSSWQQQDAQEYFAKVVDQIDYEIQRAARRKTRNLGLKMAGPQEHVIGTAELPCGKPEASDQPAGKVVFRNPLEGLLAQRVGCMQCGFTEGLSLIPFNCLTVPLGASFEYDVQDCLHDYMNLEPIEGVECIKCTLLRARDQLQNLLDQIEDDAKLPDTSDSPQIANPVKTSAQERLQAVGKALQENDFAEKTLSQKCHIPPKNRVSATKSRQAVIARAPKCLAIHVNRSVFDENTGALRKNYAALRFPQLLDLGEWCLGARGTDDADQLAEKWDTDPRESMLPRVHRAGDSPGQFYQLRAVITHYGRHENGHYICYRKYPTDVFPAHVPDAVREADGDKDKPERWYRLSDEDVQMVSEASVMSQGGVFMLFYEAVDRPALVSAHDADARADTDAEPNLTEAESSSASASTCPTPEDASALSTATEGSFSGVSPATSVSGPEKTADKTALMDVD